MKSSKPTPIVYRIGEDVVAFAARHAYRIKKGARSSGMTQVFGGSFEREIAGKIGEFAFHTFCKKNGIAIKHTPFRKEYPSLSDYDDFTIVVNGKVKIIEVKTATMKDPKKIDYGVVFYNKRQYDSKGSKDFIVVFSAVHPYFFEVSLIGWLHADKIGSFPVRKDIESDAYAVPVTKLNDMLSLKRWFYGID